MHLYAGNNARIIELKCKLWPIAWDWTEFHGSLPESQRLRNQTLRPILLTQHPQLCRRLLFTGRSWCDSFSFPLFCSISRVITCITFIFNWMNVTEEEVWWTDCKNSEIIIFRHWLTIDVAPVASMDQGPSDHLTENNFKLDLPSTAELYVNTPQLVQQLRMNLSVFSQREVM